MLIVICIYIHKYCVVSIVTLLVIYIYIRGGTIYIHICVYVLIPYILYVYHERNDSKYLKDIMRDPLVCWSLKTKGTARMLPPTGLANVLSGGFCFSLDPATPCLKVGVP